MIPSWRWTIVSGVPWALGLLCSYDSHLILALDSKSVQCVCDIYVLGVYSIFISVFTGFLTVLAFTYFVPHCRLLMVLVSLMSVVIQGVIKEKGGGSISVVLIL